MDNLLERRALPEGWEWKRLGEVCEKPEYGYTTSAKPDGEGPLFLRTTDISKGEIRWQSVPFCAEPPPDEECYSLKDGDILIARAGSVGASVVIRKPPRSIFASYLIRFRPREELNPSYAGFFLKSNMYWAQLGSKTAGTTLPGVNATNLAKVKIPLPPFATQRRIVSILEKAEDTKRLRAQADELTDRLLKSVFLEMFGDPVRNPKGWEKVRLNDVCEKIQDGTHFSPQDQTGEVPYVTAKNIRPWGIDLTDVTYVTREFHEEIYRRCDPKKGDVIYIKDGVTAGLAKVNSLDFEFSMLSSIAMIRPKSSYLNSYYLEYYLNYPATYKRIMERKSGSAITRLILREIKDINIHLPPLPLQQKFARIVEKIESMRQSQSQSKQQIGDLFSALMQKAFRGEI